MGAEPSDGLSPRRHTSPPAYHSPLTGNAPCGRRRRAVASGSPLGVDAAGHAVQDAELPAVVPSPTPPEWAQPLLFATLQCVAGTSANVERLVASVQAMKS